MSKKPISRKRYSILEIVGSVDKVGIGGDETINIVIQRHIELDTRAGRSCSTSGKPDGWPRPSPRPPTASSGTGSSPPLE